LRQVHRTKPHLIMGFPNRPWGPRAASHQARGRGSFGERAAAGAPSPGKLAPLEPQAGRGHTSSGVEVSSPAGIFLLPQEITATVDRQILPLEKMSREARPLC